MDKIPPGALKALDYLPASTQESLQEFAMRAMQNPYLIPLSTIPAAWYLAYVPHFVKAILMGVNKGIAYNNESPRSENLASYSYFPGMMIRAKAAHDNALEMFPLFAIGVLLARVQKAPADVLTSLCMKYLALRSLYTMLYIFGVNKFVAAMRTLCWVNMVKVCLNILSQGL